MRGLLRSCPVALLLIAAFLLAEAGLHVARAANVSPGFTDMVIPPPNGGNWNEAVGVTSSAAGRMFFWERPGCVWFKDPGEARVNETLTITAPGAVMITTVEFGEALKLRVAGTVGSDVGCKVQASSDLSSWTEIGTATADEGGAFAHVDDEAGGFSARYYRIAMP